jgi:hypothetical protein
LIAKTPYSPDTKISMATKVVFARGDTLTWAANSNAANRYHHIFIVFGWRFFALALVVVGAVISLFPLDGGRDRDHRCPRYRKWRCHSPSFSER